MGIVETVIIPKAEYEELLRDQELLNNLISAGVDNWEGYYGAVGEMDDHEDY